MHAKPIIGITMGDPNGIGMEVILKTLSHDIVYSFCTPVLYGSPKVFNFVKKQCALDKPVYKLIKEIEEAVPGQLNLIVSNENSPDFTPGFSSAEGGKEALLSIDRMLIDAKAGKLKAVVTAPVDKHAINQNIAFSGHTGYIAKAVNQSHELMILFADNLRVGLVTEHLPLSAVSGHISVDLIRSKAKTFIESLRKDFGIIKPKLAVLGLNPHAGDGGAIGKEESEIIAPAIKKIIEENNAIVFGPYAADGIWGSGNARNFDGILAMYHDQGLTAFKAIAFDEGVNFTAGLPFIRTSPDHGTAYDIAAKYIANPYSFSNALFAALKLLATRDELAELKSKFLPFMEHKRERFRLETRDLINM
jgi:4-hydroxythreonine-4-phosphate dehydrogenase